jgi:MFS family permease
MAESSAWPVKGLETMTSSTLSKERTAGAIQGWTLSSANWLSVIAVTAIAPVLPQIASHFASEPNSATLMDLVMSIPALFVALCAWPAGLLADKFGVRAVLLGGVALYGFAGCAPMVLDNLLGIVISRAGVGILEAIIMTTSTALVADYFRGDEREKWLAVQTGGASLIAVALSTLGGIMGQGSWRVPFAMYGIAFILFPMVLFKTWEPTQLEAKPGLDRGANPVEEKFNWGPLCLIFLLTWFCATAFYICIFQLSFILVERGVTSTSTIGLGAALFSACMCIGAFIFKYLRLPVAGKLMVSFALSACGFFVVAVAHSFTGTVVGACIQGFGSGMVLPTLITWALSKLTMQVRARGTGMWQASFFVGQFASTFIIHILKDNLGGLPNAVMCYSGFMAVAAVIAAACLFRTGFSMQLVEAE